MMTTTLNMQRRSCRALRMQGGFASVLFTIAMLLVPLNAASSAESAPDSATQPTKVNLTKSDLATANGSARIGVSSGNVYCVLTSIQTRVQLEPDKWNGEDEATNWTTWLTAFDDNLYANWIKTAPLNAQETVGIRINPDSTVVVTNNTFLPDQESKESGAQASFEAAIVASLNETLKMAKAMPVTTNKLKEVHMSLTFMRALKVLPRVGKNDYGFVGVVGDKDFTTVYERTSSDGRFPGIQIMTDNDDPGKVVPLDQAAFMKVVAEVEKL